MIFKIRISFAVFVFLACFFTAILQAAEPVIPLPADAVMVSQKGPVLGLTKSVHKRYKSSLNKNKLESFFMKELIKDGWKEDKNNKMAFVKDKDIAVIIINTYQEKDGKTGFLVACNKMLETEEVLAMHKKVPDKLKFMPIYPGSEQTVLFDTMYGVTAEYETESAMKEVVFFYKSSMLNYGWQLSREMPLKTETANCPNCKKYMPAGMADTNKIKQQADLVFKKGKTETCAIRINGIFSEARKESLEKTKISVHYSENKK